MPNSIIPRTLLTTVVLGALGLASVSTPALASYFPRGTYVATCRHIHTEGPDLFADCARVDGSWNHSRIFVPACRGDVISNRDGHLRCGQ